MAYPMEWVWRHHHLLWDREPPIKDDIKNNIIMNNNTEQNFVEFRIFAEITHYKSDWKTNSEKLTFNISLQI